MSSELELLRQRITELEAENTKLRQIIEENSKREAENAEHKVRIEELEKNSADISAENAELKAELAKLRHDFDSSNLTRPQQSQHVTNVQNSCSVGEEDISSVTAVPHLEPERHLASNDIPDPVIDQCVSIAKQHVADNSDIKSMEERETDAFLGEVYKKSVSNDIRQRNREKKLLRESSIQDSSSVTKDKKSCFSASGQSHKKREAENIVQDVFDFTATSAPEENHMTEISMTARHEKSDTDNPPNILQNLACLIQEAWDAKDEAIRANQKEILCWCSKLLPPGTKRNTIVKQTQRARNIYKLFEKIGIDKIKYITTYSANSIAELSDSQVQTIIDYFSKNPNTELPDNQDVSDIDSEEEISDDQTNALEAVSAEVSNPLEAEDDYYKMILEDCTKDCVYFDSAPQSVKETNEEEMHDSPKAVITPIPQASRTNPAYDRSYFRNKTLDQYPTLYREFSSENFDYYGITDETSCPLCELGHDERGASHEEGIEGRYEARSSEYLDWHAKLIGLPSVLTDRIRSSLYKKYKRETGLEPWKPPSQKLETRKQSIISPEQCEEKWPITFETKPEPELIIKSVLEHFPYLKFRNTFRGIDNYNFVSVQPWNSPCPICDGKHGNYGLHGEWYGTEYCLTCFTSSNKFKFAIIA